MSQVFVCVQQLRLVRLSFDCDAIPNIQHKVIGCVHRHHLLVKQMSSRHHVMC